jgi:hypothetical protein
MLPARQDLEIMSGAEQEVEFQLIRNGQPRDLTGVNVDMYIAHGYGRSWSVQKTSIPGAHHNEDEGRVRFTLTRADVPPQRSTQVWWYEIWHREDNKPHIVGELRVTGTVRG